MLPRQSLTAYSELFMKEFLIAHNTTTKTIARIYENVQWELPFIVRQPSHAPGFSILVVEFRAGVPCGIPLFDGKKRCNSWCPTVAKGPQVIPGYKDAVWTLVDVPYSNVEELLANWAAKTNLVDKDSGELFQTQENQEQKIDMASVAALAEQYREIEAEEIINEKSSVRAIKTALGRKIFPFGKYKGNTVNEVLETDVNYVRWAITNIRNFSAPTS